jgi:branched-chain amino acid transport system ATP-binding protein
MNPDVTARPAAGALLELRGVEAGYGSGTVLRGIDLSVEKGSIVALLGANGVGKTTVMRVLAGLLPARRGSVVFDGEPITDLSPAQRTARGVCLIPEGRGIFRSLTVRENLELFGPNGSTVDIDSVVEIFPVLAARLGQVAGTMSGGEQQMLALSRAFLSAPRVVLVDEVSMGLAPKLVDQIFEILERVVNSGVSLLLVEQYVRRALEVADTVYLLNRGEIVLSGATRDLDYDDIIATYLT